MKNSTRVILILICLVLAFFLIGVMIWGIMRGGLFEMGSLKVVKEETVSIEGIEDLVVKTKSSDVIVYRTEETEMRIVQKSNKSVKEKDLFVLTTSGKKLTIEGEKGITFCFGFCFFGDSVYEIYLPSSYEKNIIIESASGDITLDSTKEETFEKVNLLTISGDIWMNGPVKADSIILKSTSGDITTVSLEASEIKEQTISGDLENGTLSGEEIILKTTSGDTENQWIRGSVDISTISGDIEVDYLDVTEDSKMNSTSGDIDVVLETKSSVKMSANSVSGDIRFPNSGTVMGDGNYSLSFNTVSGDIKIRVSK